jgi:hypothetical protein
MSQKTSEDLKAALEQLYYARQLLRDIFVPVLVKYGRGTPQREDFLAAKNSVDLAIIDMENTALGGIARRMDEAAPDIDIAKQRLAARLEDLDSVRNTANKVTRALEAVEGALAKVL